MIDQAETKDQIRVVCNMHAAGTEMVIDVHVNHKYAGILVVSKDEAGPLLDRLEKRN
jgi:hypothetical protein